MNKFCTKCGSKLVNGSCPKCNPQNKADGCLSTPMKSTDTNKLSNPRDSVAGFNNNIRQQPNQPMQQPNNQLHRQTSANPQPQPPFRNGQPNIPNQPHNVNRPVYQTPPQPTFAQPPHPQPNIPNSAPVFAPPPPGWATAQYPINFIVTPETKKQKKKREKQEKKILKKNRKMQKRKDPKRKKIRRAVALTLVAAMLFSSVWGFYVLFIKQGLQMLSSEGQFSTVTGKFTDIKIKNSDSAIEAAKEISQNLGILQAADELTAKGESKYDGTSYYRLQQNFDGIPVYGRDIVILAAKNGTSQGAMSNLLDIPSDFKVDTSADTEKITKSVRNYFSNTLKVSTNSFTVDEPTKDKLVIYTIDENKEIYSAYNLSAYADGNEYTVIVDSSDATILLAAPEQVNVGSQSEPPSELIYNRTTDLSFEEILELCEKMNIEVFNADGNSINTYLKFIDSNGTETYLNTDNRTWRNGIAASDDAVADYLVFTYLSDDTPLPKIDENFTSSNVSEARALMCAAINAIDYYKTILGRDSFDNMGGYLPLVLNEYMGETANAYSYTPLTSRTMLSMGSFVNIAPDVVGHEFTHSVVASECGLIYRGESGAIDEGFADIFGEATDDWRDGIMDNDHVWENDFRNIQDPASDGLPAKYKDENWGPTWQTGNDNGYVHDNSTVISHAAYLMVSGTGGSAPIPTETLTKLLYRTILTLPSNATFSCFRQHVEDNARLMKLSRDYKETIKVAFDEVGIENGATDINNYAKEFDLTVFDINAEEYTDYTLEIEGKYRDNLGLLREYSSDDIRCSSSPMKVSLDNFGTYLLTVRDRGGSDKVYSKLITVMQIIDEEVDFQYTELKITTSFGDPFFDSGNDDEDSVRLKGQLRDTITNAGISGASVTLVQDEEGRTYTVRTDHNGYYQTNVKPGLYYITCSASGYNKVYSSVLVDGNTTVRKPILLLWTDERLMNNPISNWLDTLFTYIMSLITRAIESIVWEAMDSALGDVVEKIPFLEKYLE